MHCNRLVGVSEKALDTRAAVLLGRLDERDRVLDHCGGLNHHRRRRNPSERARDARGRAFTAEGLGVVARVWRFWRAPCGGVRHGFSSNRRTPEEGGGGGSDWRTTRARDQVGR